MRILPGIISKIQILANYRFKRLKDGNLVFHTLRYDFKNVTLNTIKVGTFFKRFKKGSKKDKFLFRGTVVQNRKKVTKTPLKEDKQK